MDLDKIKDWLIPVSTSFSLIVTAWAASRSLREFRLKMKAEKRLKEGARVESDIQLLKLFTEIMNTAHARGASSLSEKAVEAFLRSDMSENAVVALLKSTSPEEFETGRRRLKDLVSAAVVTLPVGIAAQDAAIAAIATLGLRHEVLRGTAVQALQSLGEIRPEVAAAHLRRLEKGERTPLQR